MVFAHKGNEPRAMTRLPHLFLTKALRGQTYYPHFIQEGNEGPER